MLAIAGLAYAYGRTHVLADVSLTIAAGEIVGLVGPNGAGKSVGGTGGWHRCGVCAHVGVCLAF